MVELEQKKIDTTQQQRRNNLKTPVKKPEAAKDEQNTEQPKKVKKAYDQLYNLKKELGLIVSTKGNATNLNSSVDPNLTLNKSQEVQNQSYSQDAQDASGFYGGKVNEGKKKIRKILRLAESVDEEMNKLANDPKDLPTNLKVKMAEFLAFLQKLKAEFISQTFVATESFEVKHMKATIRMLWRFLYHVLADNKRQIDSKRGKISALVEEGDMDRNEA